MKLIIAEKPKAARKIAEALGSFKVRKKGKAVWYDLGEILVVPAVGHVYGLFPAKGGWDYPIFDVEWKPKYEKKGFEYVRQYIRNLQELGKKAEEVIVATDYDVEGSVIGYNIVRFALKRNIESVKRMKFSTLTKNELRKAFENAHLHNNFELGMIRAGLTRHYLDWYWGINLSRALSHSIKKAGEFRILSTGRVQGPTLKILVDREREIRKFESRFFYKLFAKIKGFEAEGPEFEALGEALEAFKKARSPAVVLKVEKRRSRILPPPPFNLTDLQTEASRVLKLTPKQTLDIAQSLYEGGYISYPRTSSQKLPKDLDTDEILEKVSAIVPQAKYLRGKKAREGEKEDPAHPAIYPTGEIPQALGRKEKALYELIVRRFVASFADEAIRESTKITLDAGVKFELRGIRTVLPGFTAIYPAGLEEKAVPELREGERVPVSEFRIERKQRAPPKRFTPASLIKLMEKLNLGTKATRADIIQTLYDRGYIRGKSIEVTPLGERVVEALEELVPDVLSVDLTREFERKMEEVHEGKTKMDEVLREAREKLTQILEKFRKNERRIGEKLYSGSSSKEVLGKCPECGSDVIILKSKAKKRFAKCTGCGKTWGLPQRGKLEITGEKCPYCSLFLIEIKRDDTRFKLCIEHGFI